MKKRKSIFDKVEHEAKVSISSLLLLHKCVNEFVYIMFLLYYIVASVIIDAQNKQIEETTEVQSK